MSISALLSTAIGGDTKVRENTECSLQYKIPNPSHNDLDEWGQESPTLINQINGNENVLGCGCEQIRLLHWQQQD